MHAAFVQHMQYATIHHLYTSAQGIQEAGGLLGKVSAQA
jgi:hypothetical protein